MNENNVTELYNKINRLIDRFFNGKVVPFIGAGISINAKYKGNELANTKTMTKSIAKKLFNLYDKKEQWTKWCCSSLKCKNHDEEKCPLYEESLDKLCEIYTWATGQNGFKSLVKNVLLIPDFNNLPPQAAHRYISMLAREGLIDEIITTNYDSCFEEAYKETFQERPVGTALVITNLNEYRQFSGRFYTESGYQCLKIYKINGCADKLKQDGNYFSKILLMERQLQNWGERRWARDLFNDCLRSRTLVFSGFGSNEPQVRHTALQIAEEFENPDNNNPGNKQMSCWDLPNAPFIAAFDDALSFNQVQILYSYAHAHNDFDLLKNVFTGTDTKSFDPKAEEDQLPADIFWEKVYQAAFWRLFTKYCKLDTAFFAYLSSCVYPVESLLIGLNNWLIPNDRPFGRFPELLKIDKNSTCTLTKWINYVRHGCSCKTGQYISLKEKPVLLPLVLLILFLISDNTNQYEEIIKKVKIENDLLYLIIYESMPVFIIHDTEVLKKALESKKICNTISIGIIVSNKLGEEAEEIHHIVKTSEPDNQGKELSVKKRVTIYKLPIRDVFYWDAKIPKSVLATRNKFLASLRSAKVITSNARRQIRTRIKNTL